MSGKGSSLAYVRLCKVDDVSVGDIKQFNVGENEILVVNLNGQFYCLDARCTHAGAPLAEGELTGDALTCPWHGSIFNVTNGAVLKGPAEKPLKVYQSVMKENFLFVEL